MRHEPALRGDASGPDASSSEPSGKHAHPEGASVWQEALPELDEAGSAASFMAPKGALPKGSPRLAVLALALGFLGFGAAIGLITGFSSAQGVSTGLLSAVFSFVGGALLTFTGFRRPSLLGGQVLDPVRFGAALGCLSLGLLLGIVAGVMGRCHVQVQSLLLGQTVTRSQCSSAGEPPASAPAPSVRERVGAAGLMAGESSRCKLAFKALNKGIQQGEASRVLSERVSEVLQACELASE